MLDLVSNLLDVASVFKKLIADASDKADTQRRVVKINADLGIEEEITKRYFKCYWRNWILKLLVIVPFAWILKMFCDAFLSMSNMPSLLGIISSILQ